MNKKILAIEDDPQIAELLELLLQSPEITVINCQNGREGYETAIADPPSLILLDVMIPEMTGWEVYDALRAHERTFNIPVIMLSVSLLEPDRRPLFTNSKINFYQNKPFDVLKLRRIIREILGSVNWGIADTPPPAKPNTGTLKPITGKLLNGD